MNQALILLVVEAPGAAPLGAGPAAVPSDVVPADGTGTDPTTAVPRGGAVEIPLTMGNQQANRWSGEPAVRRGGSLSRHLSRT